jgi:hypothetical protein
MKVKLSNPAGAPLPRTQRNARDPWLCPRLLSVACVCPSPCAPFRVCAELSKLLDAKAYDAHCAAGGH